MLRSESPPSGITAAAPSPLAASSPNASETLVVSRRRGTAAAARTIWVTSATVATGTKMKKITSSQPGVVSRSSTHTPTATIWRARLRSERMG